MFLSRKISVLVEITITYLAHTGILNGLAHDCATSSSSPLQDKWLELEVDEWVIGILVDEDYAYKE